MSEREARERKKPIKVQSSNCLFHAPPLVFSVAKSLSPELAILTIHRDFATLSPLDFSTQKIQFSVLSVKKPQRAEDWENFFGNFRNSALPSCSFVETELLILPCEYTSKWFPVKNFLQIFCNLCFVAFFMSSRESLELDYSKDQIFETTSFELCSKLFSIVFAVLKRWARNCCE